MEREMKGDEKGEETGKQIRKSKIKEVGNRATLGGEWRKSKKY